MITRLLIIYCLFLSQVFAGEICCGKKLEGYEEVKNVEDFSQDNIQITTKLKDCEHKLTEEEIEKVFKELIDSYFPKLKDVSLGITYFNSDAYFFAAGYGGFDGILSNAKNRKYSIEVSKAILNGRVCAPPPLAVRSILAHELLHIQDYLERGFGGLVGLGTKYIPFNEGARNNYERHTDERVLDIAVDKKDPDLVKGLKEYRNWIYPQLSADDLKTKKIQYLTPEEIDKYAQKKEGQ